MLSTIDSISKKLNTKQITEICVLISRVSGFGSMGLNYFDLMSKETMGMVAIASVAGMLVSSFVNMLNQTNKNRFENYSENQNLSSYKM